MGMRGEKKKEKVKGLCEIVTLCSWTLVLELNERRKHVRALDDITVWALIYRITLRSSSIQFAIRKSSMRKRIKVVTIQGM